MPDVLFAPWRYEYLVSDKNVACIFCEAAASRRRRGSRSSCSAGKRVFVLLNRYPYTNGHVMVAPLAHEAWFSDSSPETLDELIATVARAQTILVAEYRTDGLNVGVNFGSAAGAGVADHYHVHVVPRWTGDTNFMTVTGGVRVVPEDLGVTRRRLATLFAGASMSAETAPRRSTTVAMVLAWLVPGLGHFYLGRRRTAVAFALIVAATFLAGLSFQGRLYTIEDGQPLTILATFAVYGAGLLNLVARGAAREPRAGPSSRRRTSTAARTC